MQRLVGLTHLPSPGSHIGSPVLIATRLKIKMKKKKRCYLVHEKRRHRLSSCAGILHKGLIPAVSLSTRFPAHLVRLVRDREKRVWRWGKREIIYLSLHCHHQNDSCSDEPYPWRTEDKYGQDLKDSKRCKRFSKEKNPLLCC